MYLIDDVDGDQIFDMDTLPYIVWILGKIDWTNQKIGTNNTKQTTGMYTSKRHLVVPVLFLVCNW